MIPKPIETVKFSDLEALLVQSVSEGRTLEYKSQLSMQKSSDKISGLLKPICAFANTDGGDVIYGIQENKGVPASIPGLAIENLDSELLKLEQIISSGIQPKITGVRIHKIHTPSKSVVIVIRVPRSWNAPHRVSENRSFYARNSAGTYDLEVSEIKNMILLSENVADKIRSFRDKRNRDITHQRISTRLSIGMKCSLHIIPISSFTRSQLLSVADIKAFFPSYTSKMLPNSHGYFAGRINLDGYMNVAGIPDQEKSGYSQVYRSGIVEHVYVYEPFDEVHELDSAEFESNVIAVCKTALSFYDELSVEGPFYVFLSLLGTTGFKLRTARTNRFGRDTFPQFHDSDLILPEIEVESTKQDIASALRPVFDMVWNAAGLDCSANYNTLGDWVGYER